MKTDIEREKGNGDNPDEFCIVYTDGTNSCLQLVPRTIGKYASITLPSINAGEYNVVIRHKENTVNRGSADIYFNNTLFAENYSFIGAVANRWTDIKFNQTVTFTTSGPQVFKLVTTYAQGIMLDSITFTPVENENPEPDTPVVRDYVGEDAFIATDYNIDNGNIVGITPNTLAKHFTYRVKVKNIECSSALFDSDGN